MVMLGYMQTSGIQRHLDCLVIFAFMNIVIGIILIKMPYCEHVKMFLYGRYQYIVFQ